MDKICLDLCVSYKKKGCFLQKKVPRRSRQILSFVFFEKTPWTKSARIYAALFLTKKVMRRSRQILSFVFLEKSPWTKSAWIYAGPGKI